MDIGSQGNALEAYRYSRSKICPIREDRLEFDPN